MKRYIALLRGINISGKNKVDMSELKNGLLELGYIDVVTYLNSGNVIFSTDEDEEIIKKKIETMINEKFDLDISIFVIAQDYLRNCLDNAPKWWGINNKEIYDNLIFILSTLNAEDIMEKIGLPTEEIEQVYIYNNVIFWSFDRQKYAKSNWWKKTASHGISEMLTIRTASTLKKIAMM